MRTDKIMLAILAVILASAAAYAVDLAPTIQISVSPSNNVESTATITVIATDVLDNAGIQKIDFYTNNALTNTKPCGRTTPCILTQTITKHYPAQESYYAIATDNGNNAATSTTITVTYRGIDTPPTLAQLPNQTIPEDSGMHNLTDLWQYAQDSWTADENLTYAVTAQTNTSLANCLIDNNKYLNCTTVEGNATGNSNITISVNDGRFTAYSSFWLTVENVNDKPELIQPIPVLSVNEDESNLTINLSQYFIDIDGPALTYSFITNTTVLTAQTAGDYLNLTAHNNYYGTENIIIIASDSLNQTNTTATVIILPVNDVPYFNETLANKTAIIDLPFLYDINASDIDITDTLSYYDNTTLFDIDLNTGLINFTPNIFSAGNHTILITACDNSGAWNNCANQTFNLEIIYIPRPGFFNSTPSSVFYTDPGYYEVFIDIINASQIDTVLFEFSNANRTATHVTDNKYKANLTELSTGNYTYRWHANYTNTLLNTSQLYTLEIRAATPQLTISIQPATTVQYGTLTNVSCYASTNQGWQLLMNRGTVPVLNPDINTNLAGGTYNYSCVFQPSQNYTLEIAYAILNITPRTVIMNLSIPASIMYGNPTNASCTIDTNLTTPLFYNNWSSVPNPDNTILPAGAYNYTCLVAPTSNFNLIMQTGITIVQKAVPKINLTLNLTHGDYYVPINSTIPLQASAIPSTHTIYLYMNGNQINAGTSPITNMTFFGTPGWQNITAFYPATQNYTSDFLTRYVIVASPLTKTNINPISGSHFNQTTITLSFNTNLNTTCRWSTTDSDYNSMTNNFATTGFTTHSTTITGLMLGTNNMYAACINDTSLTNLDLTYILDNIIEQGSALLNGATAALSILYSTRADNSTLTSINATGSIINRSTLTNCVIINSTVKDYTGSNCYIINSIIDPSNITGSTINASTVMSSNVTNSYVDHSSITDSNIDYSTIIYSTLVNITATGTTIRNTDLQSVILIDAIINNNVITGGTIIQGNMTYNASSSGSANLSQLINLPPTAVISAPASSTPGAAITFDASQSTDPNIGQSGPYNSTILTYQWDFGEGNTSTGITTTHTYNAEGTYNVRLTVTDAYGLNSTTTQAITISTPSSPPPSGGGGSGGGGGGGGYVIPKTYTYDLDSGMHFQRSLTPYDTLIIIYKGSNHSFKIAGITKQDATLLIDDKASKLINTQIQKYDLDNDHYYDMEATFLNNYQIRAEFRLRPVQELVPGYSPFPAAPATKTIVHETELPEPEQETEQPEDEEEETETQATTEEKGIMAKLWSKIKTIGTGITGAVIGASKSEETGGTAGILILLAVVIAGIFIYWIYSEWF